MSDYKPAREAIPGQMVVDPSSGLWCQLCEVQEDGGHLWLLWGTPRPPGSIATRVAADREVLVRDAASREETWDDWVE